MKMYNTYNTNYYIKYVIFALMTTATLIYFLDSHNFPLVIFVISVNVIWNLFSLTNFILF